MILPITTIGYFHTGSNYICNPPVTNTDIDYMCLVQSIPAAKHVLNALNWTPCAATEYPDNNWTAYRKGNINLLVTADAIYFAKFYHATEIAKKLNLLEKGDRISLFNSILGKPIATTS